MVRKPRTRDIVFKDLVGDDPEKPGRSGGGTLIWNLFALFSMMFFVGTSYAQGLDEIIGKWSDSSHKNTCKIPVGSSPTRI